MELDRRHLAAKTVIVKYFDFVDGAEIPRVCLSPSDTVATFTQALAMSLAHALLSAHSVHLEAVLPQSRVSVMNPLATLKLDRGDCIFVNHSDFVDGADVPRVYLSPSDTVATCTQALAVSLASRRTTQQHCRREVRHVDVACVDFPKTASSSSFDA